MKIEPLHEAILIFCGLFGIALLINGIVKGDDLRLVFRPRPLNVETENRVASLPSITSSPDKTVTDVPGQIVKTIKLTITPEWSEPIDRRYEGGLYGEKFNQCGGFYVHLLVRDADNTNSVIELIPGQNVVLPESWERLQYRTKEETNSHPVIGEWILYK